MNTPQKMYEHGGDIISIEKKSMLKGYWHFMCAYNQPTKNKRRSLHNQSETMYVDYILLNKLPIF